MASCRHLHDGGLAASDARYDTAIVSSPISMTVWLTVRALPIHIDADRFTARPAMLMEEILGAPADR